LHINVRQTGKEAIGSPFMKYLLDGAFESNHSAHFLFPTLGAPNVIISTF